MIKSISKTLAIILIAGLTTLTSCKTKGCTDPASTNYNPDATQDDGSCTYQNIQGFNISYSATYTYEMDGDLVNFDGNYEVPTAGYIGASVPNSNMIWRSGFVNQASVYAPIMITKGVHSYTNADFTEADFLQYFAPNSYSFASNGTDDGIVMYVATSDGVAYQSNLGSQANSAFNIEASQQEYVNGEYYVKTYCTFNCKVYNVNDITDVKTITNGEQVNHFGPMD